MVSNGRLNGCTVFLALHFLFIGLSAFVLPGASIGRPKIMDSPVRPMGQKKAWCMQAALDVHVVITCL